jgi:cell filamentation protein
MYNAIDDPYCYPGTTVLRNRKKLKSQTALSRFETAMTAQRFDEPLPDGRLSLSHYKAVHHHLFQDIYTWAGRFRTVRIGKQGSMFCYPENIDREMRQLFARLRRDKSLRGLSADEFARAAATFLSTLNAIHAFRNGNGRTQLAFVALLAQAAGHPLKLRRLRPRKILDAMIRSFHGDATRLAAELRRLL